MDYHTEVARSQFERQMRAAVETVRQVLEAERNPKRLDEIPHAYEDKFAMVNYSASCTLQALGPLFRILGLDDDKAENEGLSKLARLQNWVEQGRTVSLGFVSSERCTFKEKQVKKEDSNVEHVSTGFLGIQKSKTVYKTTTYHWLLDVDYKTYLFAGVGGVDSDRIPLTERRTTGVIVTSTEDAPLPESSEVERVSVDITNLLPFVFGAKLKQFEIDRRDKDCHTPRRNKNVEELLESFLLLKNMLDSVYKYFSGHLGSWKGDENSKLDWGMVSSSKDKVFLPVVPLSESSEEAKLFQDITKFMDKYESDLANQVQLFKQSFPGETDNTKLISSKEATLCCMTQVTGALFSRLKTCVDYVEHQLYHQLVSAIGKEVELEHINQYMSYDYSKLYKSEFAPKAFYYDIRQPGHAPEGTLSVEADGNEILTSVKVRAGEDALPMTFSISASTKVSIEGPQFLHGYVQQQFSTETPSNLKLKARARQFSSFVLLVGNIAAKDKFAPQYGIIIQNKDEVVIPLLLNPLPTPKAFRDAIESLSPEQKQFCKMFRKMQLESSLFAVCVVEIKPQLEKLLNLPPNALMKEIKLTQDLIKLFCEFQVPTDLLTYDGSENAEASRKVNTVREHVKSVLDMIDESKKQEIINERLATENELHQSLQDRGAYLDGMVVESARLSKSRSRARPMAYGGSMNRPRGGPSPPPPPQPMQMQQPFQVNAMMGGGHPTQAAPGADAFAYADIDMAIEMQEDMADDDAEASGTNNDEESFGKQPGQQQQLPQEERDSENDYTQVPIKLDASFDRLDAHNALRPTTVKAGTTWTKLYYANLISKQSQQQTLYEDQLKKETARAMDLLDALSRSGEVPLIETSLHVMVCATHMFDETVMKTVIKQNINPIEHIEASSLIVSSTIFNVPCNNLLASDSDRNRLKEASPQLFGLLQN